MLKIQRKILVVLLLVELVLPCIFIKYLEASENSSGYGTINESEAIRKSLEKSPGFRSLQNEVLAQSKIVAFAGYNVRNPELRLSDISTKYFDEDDENLQFQIGLRWKPPKIGELGLKQRKELVSLWEKKVDAWKKRQNLIADVRETYAMLAMFQTYTVLSQRQVKLQGELLAIVEKLGELGRRSLLDRVKVRRKYMKVITEDASILEQYEKTRQHFSELTGESENITVSWSEPEILALDKDYIHGLVITNNPALKLAKQRSELTAYRYKAERYKLIPWFSFVDVSYKYESKKKDSGELVLGIELPFFNWNLGNLRATAIRSKQENNLSDLRIISIDQKIKEYLAEYDKAVAEYLALKDEVNGSISWSENMAEQARLQEMPEDEILEIEILNNELKMMLFKAGFKVKKAAIRLCQAAGVENNNSLVKE